MTPLDQMISDDRLQLLKAAIPYAPAAMRNTLSVYAKFRELQSVMALAQQPPAVQMMSSGPGPARGLEMLKDIGSYTSGQIHDLFEQMSSAMETLRMLQMYQEMAEGGTDRSMQENAETNGPQEQKGDQYERLDSESES